MASKEPLTTSELRSRRYHKNRLDCEKLGLQVVPLNEKSLERRVKMNLGQLKNHLHPKMNCIDNFCVKEDMLKPLDLIDNEKRDCWYVEEKSTLYEMCGILKGKKTIAFDTELDVEFSYYPLTTLIQISCDTHDFIVDTIPLFDEIKYEIGLIFSDENILKIVFSTNDLLSLQRDFDIFCCCTIDFQNVLVQKHKQTDISFEKAVQWYVNANYEKSEKNQMFLFRLRPLPKHILEYAKNDSKYLLFAWEKFKSLYKDWLINEKDGFHPSHCRYWMLRVYEFKRKTVMKCWNKVVKSLTPDQTKQFTTEKYWFTFVKIYNWRENTAKLRNTRTYRVISRGDLIMFCIVKPKNVKMLTAIWSRANDFDDDAKESLVFTINDERMIYVTDDDSDDDWSKQTHIYEVKNDSASTTTCESKETEEAVSTAANDSGYMEVDQVENIVTDDKGCNIDKVAEVCKDNPYDNVFNDKLVTNDDLLNNFDKMRKSKMPKIVLNRLRRRRKKLRHPLINEDRTRRGLPTLDFQRKRLRK